MGTPNTEEMIKLKDRVWKRLKFRDSLRSFLGYLYNGRDLELINDYNDYEEMLRGN